MKWKWEKMWIALRWMVDCIRTIYGDGMDSWAWMDDDDDGLHSTLLCWSLIWNYLTLHKAAKWAFSSLLDNQTLTHYTVCNGTICKHIHLIGYRTSFFCFPRSYETCINNNTDNHFPIEQPKFTLIKQLYKNLKCNTKQDDIEQISYRTCLCGIHPLAVKVLSPVASKLPGGDSL